MSEDKKKMNKIDINKINQSVSSSFCVLPWIHRFINIDGDAQVCCVSEEFDNQIKNKIGQKKFYEKIKNDKEISNSYTLKKIRKSMLNNEWSKMCERCLSTEKNGGYSRRQYENFQFTHVIDDIFLNTKKDGSTDSKIHSIDFRLGNLCNLSCRMCSPRSSIKWLKNWNEIDQDWWKISNSKKKKYESITYYKNNKVWENFKELIPSLEHMHFAGGEPFLVKEMIEALKLCVELGYSKNIWLSYNTNLTILPKELLNLWKHFKFVKLYVSIDAIGSLNDYIRYPSNWQKIVKNLIELDLNYKELNLNQVLISTTVQMYNILHLPELFQFFDLNFKNIYKVPQLTNLYNPPFYKTQCLPLGLKNKVQKELTILKQKYLDDFQKGFRKIEDISTLSSIDDVILFMNENDESWRLNDFFRAALSKDRLHKNKLFDYVPELRPYFNSNILKTTSANQITESSVKELDY